MRSIFAQGKPLVKPGEDVAKVHPPVKRDTVAPVDPSIPFVGEKEPIKKENHPVERDLPDPKTEPNTKPGKPVAQQPPPSKRDTVAPVVPGGDDQPVKGKKPNGPVKGNDLVERDAADPKIKPDDKYAKPINEQPSPSKRDAFVPVVPDGDDKPAKGEGPIKGSGPVTGNDPVERDLADPKIKPDGKPGKPVGEHPPSKNSKRDTAAPIVPVPDDKINKGKGPVKGNGPVERDIADPEIKPDDKPAPVKGQPNVVFSTPFENACLLGTTLTTLRSRTKCLATERDTKSSHSPGAIRWPFFVIGCFGSWRRMFSQWTDMSNAAS